MAQWLVMKVGLTLGFSAQPWCGAVNYKQEALLRDVNITLISQLIILSIFMLIVNVYMP